MPGGDNARRQGKEVPMFGMRRRDFITLLGGAAVAWPLAARAQQPDRMRRIGMLWIIAETDPQATKNREAFLKQLHQLGWRAGDNVLSLLKTRSI
jgi:putative ABC transport system substrate-binding protein